MLLEGQAIAADGDHDDTISKGRRQISDTLVETVEKEEVTRLRLPAVQRWVERWKASQDLETLQSVNIPVRSKRMTHRFAGRRKWYFAHKAAHAVEHICSPKGSSAFFRFTPGE